MTCLNYFKVHYLPGITCAWFMLSFILTYLISIVDGNVYPLFPNISDTGALPPESCIFSQLVNMGVILMMMTMYIRYLHVKEAINVGEIQISTRWNTWSIIIGLLACLGTSVVANFQETTNIAMHVIGASTAFGIGSIYFCLQTKISYECKNIQDKYSSYKIGTKLYYFRLFLSICLFPLFISHVVCGHKAISQFTGESIVWWTKDLGGFQLRLAGSFTEWILVFFVFIYFATFTVEFKTLEYKGIQIKVKDKKATSDVFL